MAIQLCTRCNLNYVKPGMTYCKICTMDLKKDLKAEESVEVCPVCGVASIVANQDMCQSCLKSRVDMSGYVIEDENVNEDSENATNELDGMRLVDLENDAPEDIREEFDEE